MPHERLRPSFVFDEERLKQLQQIAPEAFADGNINWEVLKESLGECLEEEGAEAEHFGLFWPGKREARKLASLPSKGTLIPDKGEGIDEDKTKNIFIEGENLEVLKLLQKSYAGKIKMIYIDPPYNTGNDFIYDDNFTEPLEEYLKYTGQMDEEGKLLTTNKKADGRFHSKWLSMMYPRLRLARNLLTEDGVIFVSIDDNEAVHLKQVLDEVFGEENFISSLIWKANPRGRAMDKFFATTKEYILVFFKNQDKAKILMNKIEDEEKIGKYSEKDDKSNYKKGYPLHNGTRNFHIDNRPNLAYTIYYNPNTEDAITRDEKKKNPKGGYFIEENFIEKDLTKKEYVRIIPSLNNQTKQRRVWRWGQEKFLREYKEELLFVKESEGYYIYQKDRLTPEGVKLEKFKDIIENIRTDEGGLELQEIFGKKLLDFPKPSRLIKHLMSSIELEEDDIVIDFFAGSATTAQACFSSNIDQLQNRKFICIQLPELCNENSEAFKAGYKNIAEIAKDRIEKVAKTIKEKIKGSMPGLDFGFKTFRLQRSNFKQWQDYKGKDPKELTSLFKEHETPLIDGWKPENLLVEAMLQQGFPLDSDTLELKEYKKNAVTQVKSEFCEHKLLVCFDKKIYQETIDTLDIQREDIFVCLDSALSDEQKITLSDKGFLKTI